MKSYLIICFVYLLSCSTAKKQVIQNEIKGTVVNSNNQTVNDVAVQFYNDGNDFGFVPKVLKTDKNGYFFVEKVKVKGDYRIVNMMSEKLPRKIIFKKEGYLTDTIKIVDYSNVKKDEAIEINIILKKEKSN